MLPVNEIFETIQGEAYWTGTPSVFIRLQGCGVGCPWCDTKYTWHLKDSQQDNVLRILDKKEASPTWALFDVHQLIGAVESCKARHVVLTGGEPADYNLHELTEALIVRGCTVQIETSGTAEIGVHNRTWVTCSPKVDMPGGLKVLDSALNRANEIKMPIGKPSDIDKLRVVLSRVNGSQPLVWLQPLSQSKKATALCVSEATKNNWRISIQTHKFLGLR
jgi:7-carboxy-7-deazaguanine synthase